MRLNKKLYYTLVRHSSYTIDKQVQFSKAVEERCIRLSEANAIKLKSIGFVLVSSWQEANQLGDKYNYGLHNASVYPNAPGRFVKLDTIIDEELFVPTS